MASSLRRRGSVGQRETQWDSRTGQKVCDTHTHASDTWNHDDLFLPITLAMISDVQLAAVSNWLGSFGMVLIVAYHVSTGFARILLLMTNSLSCSSLLSMKDGLKPVECRHLCHLSQFDGCCSTPSRTPCTSFGRFRNDPSHFLNEKWLCFLTPHAIQVHCSHTNGK